MLSGHSATSSMKPSAMETKVGSEPPLLTPVSHPTREGPGNWASALIVEPSLPDALKLIPIMSALGIHVTVAESFQDAKDALRSPYTLLVTELRLGEFNGLHLALRAKATHQAIKTIVTSWVDDIYLQADAEALGAAFIVKPISEKDWSAAVERTMAGAFSQAFPLRAPFERRSGERRQRSVYRSDERRRVERRGVRWKSAEPSGPDVSEYSR